MGLTREAFTLSVQKAVQTISVFRNTDEPMSIGILVDTSGSMQMPDVREIARPKPISEAIQRFLQLGNEENEYFLASFDVNFRELTDWVSSKHFRANMPVIAQEKKGTALHDALLAALAKLKTGRHQKRVLLLFSDGIDGVSTHKYSELKGNLRDSDVIVYAVGPRQVFGSPFWPIKIVMKEGERVLAELTSMTGGVGFVPENKNEFDRVVEQIAIELRHQYRIGFSANQTASPNKWHRLNVKVTAPVNAPKELSKLTVRARQGYYPR